MCIQDLQLGKGRFAATPVRLFGTNTTITALLGGDARRVAVSLSLNGTVQNIAGGSFVAPDYAELFSDSTGWTTPFLVLTAYDANRLLRIEDWGQIVMGEIRANVTDFNTNGTYLLAAAILTNVEAEALRIGKP